GRGDSQQAATVTQLVATLFIFSVSFLQARLLPYTPSQEFHCHNPREEYYNENIQKCCSLCPPSFRVHQKCDNSVDTKCVPCGEGLFNMAWSRASRCFSCSPPCKEGTRETDVECAPCQPGTFSDHESHQNVCTPHRTCQPVLVPGNSTHNTVCGNPGGQVNPRTTTPQLTTATKRLLWRPGTERPTFNQQDPLAQTGEQEGKKLLAFSF
uniref:TNFR-Cys domain-containing protein n=1 Tax=Pseudonaja textilis TaxID=8673 RepID=A0A670ZLN5_PSETE